MSGRVHAIFLPLNSQRAADTENFLKKGLWCRFYKYKQKYPAKYQLNETRTVAV